MDRFKYLFASLFFSSTIFGQKVNNHISVKLIESNLINIDGVMNEAVWETTDSISNFQQFFPSDSVSAKYQTRLKMLCSEHILYIGIRAYTHSNKFVVSSLRRDFGGAGSDNISLMFDTYRDGANAFLFSVTPYGVQRDVLVSGGGETFNATWDIKWQVKSKRYNNYYDLEIAQLYLRVKRCLLLRQMIKNRPVIYLTWRYSYSKIINGSWWLFMQVDYPNKILKSKNESLQY